MTSERSLRIEVPNAAEDRPRLGRVGIVAGVGFVLGIAWPWLAGVELVPSAPVDEPRAATPTPSASAAASAVASAAPVASAEPAAEDSLADRIKIGNLTITSCRDSQDKTVEQCGELQFDAVAKARIHALSGCPAAEHAHGMLSLGLELDFKKKKVERLLRGASTTLPDATAEGLLRCANAEFETASLDGVEHAHASYTVFYLVEFLPPGKRASDEAGEGTEAADETTNASGMATVSWNIAIIRDGPSADAARVARIMSGTRVAVVGRRNDWYKVKYDAKGSEGWVYKSAIGL